MEGAMIVGLYLLPTFVACAFDRRNKWIIAILNLLLGWTIIGWVVLLVVSILARKSNVRERNV
jgi:hypothetical protein